ncbi:MAG: DUF3298 and DUF4163 domain-containing protein [Haliscomenobacter sp.]|nr:DUF3298 and DUF4163 domain-containing protein [Haliscomenobacter sp.]MBK8653741.1 DUF3298 and DUF4163 domain-containing protein [Haliscomenobacter sp.]MBP9077891.1 DUF3298 and DUF4163 domain-containing protein [Haliscomenobacter sp.]MBP9873901.1 DUF3298 and DUF4163 domain-containing protein [Haliscomenobacter sp.]
MQVFRWAGLIVLVVLFQTCAKNHKEDAAQTEKPLPEFRMESFSKEIQDCNEGKNYCAKVNVVYPVFVSGIQPVILRYLNDSILFHVKNSLAILEQDRDLRRFSFQALADSFFLAYTTYGQETGFPMVWELETTSEVLFLSSGMVSIALENYAYTGGAHPNSHSMLLNYNLKYGRVLSLKDLVRDVDGLKYLAEKAFRDSRDLSPDEDLNEAGFFGDNGFQLPSNFGVTPEGLYFYYNSYEIASYAAGPTDFVLTWEELGDLARTELIK